MALHHFPPLIAKNFEPYLDLPNQNPPVVLRAQSPSTKSTNRFSDPMKDQSTQPPD
jgi:hypothetical protein